MQQANPKISAGEAGAGPGGAMTAAILELSPGALLPAYPALSSCTQPGAAPTQHQGRDPSWEQD